MLRATIPIFAVLLLPTSACDQKGAEEADTPVAAVSQALEVAPARELPEAAAAHRSQLAASISSMKAALLQETSPSEIKRLQGAIKSASGEFFSTHEGIVTSTVAAPIQTPAFERSKAFNDRLLKLMTNYDMKNPDDVRAWADLKKAEFAK